MEPGSLGMKFSDRESPLQPHIMALGELSQPQFPMTAWMFAAAAEEYMREYGLTAEQLAWIGYKNHKHSVNNPYSQFQDEYSLEDILSSRTIVGPLTKLQCSPTSDGSAAAIVASEEFVDTHGLADQAVEIVGQATVTDREDTFDGTAAGIVGANMNKVAIASVYAQAQIGPDDLDVVELHDCFSANEILVYEALGFCEPGAAGKLIDNQDTTFGGKWVVNPSGRLISKGHPLGATGLAQCAELNWQLRGKADKRQVAGAATKDGVACNTTSGWVARWLSRHTARPTGDRSGHALRGVPAHRRAASDRVALRTVGGGVVITWRQYRERVREIASGLAGLGVGPGTRWH